MEEVLKLIDDYRYLGALQRYEDLLQQIQHSEYPAHSKALIEASIMEHDKEIKLMLHRSKEVQDVLNEDEDESGWILGLELFGIRTHYQYDSATNFVKIKMEGMMEDLPLFEQTAVIHEVDLFHEWVPFCNESKLIEKVGKAELFPYFCVGVTGFSRDVLMNCYGADCLFEKGKLVILGKSVDAIPSEKEVPFKPDGWFHCRADVHEMVCLVDVFSPTSAKVRRTTLFLIYFFACFNVMKYFSALL